MGQELGRDHRQRLYLQSQLANVLRSQGRYKQAKEKDQEVFNRQLATIGEGDPHTWITASGLAADLRALGCFDDALEMDQKTYLRLKEIFDENHPRTLSAANNLAVSFRLVVIASAHEIWIKQPWLPGKSCWGRISPIPCFPRHILRRICVRRVISNSR